MEHLACVGMRFGDGLVDLHSESRLLRRNDVAVLPLEGLLQDVRVKALPALDTFQDQEIRAAGGELDIRRAHDRPAVEMRRNLRVMNLGEAGDLLRFEQSADAA